MCKVGTDAKANCGRIDGYGNMGCCPAGYTWSDLRDFCAGMKLPGYSSCMRNDQCASGYCNPGLAKTLLYVTSPKSTLIADNVVPGAYGLCTWVTRTAPVGAPCTYSSDCNRYDGRNTVCAKDSYGAQTCCKYGTTYYSDLTYYCDDDLGNGRKCQAGNQCASKRCGTFDGLCY